MAQGVRARSIAVLGAVAAVLTLVGVVTVRADPPPPPVAADRLLADALNALSRPFSVSGEVRTELDIGLPELPSALGAGAEGAAASLIGRQTYRVWRSPDGFRVAHLFDFSEQVLVANHVEGWSWDSNGMVATRLRLDAVRSEWQGAIPGGDVLLPSDADVVAGAERVLRALAPYAEVSVDGGGSVAGRSVYDLVLVPRSVLTLIGRVEVSIDAATRLPLRLRVVPKGTDDAAIEAGFTSVSFDPVDPGMFDFTPPAGAEVRDAAVPPGAPEARRRGVAGGIGSEPVVIGEGFDTRIAVRLSEPVPAEVRQLVPYAGPLASAVTVARGGHTWLLFGFVGIDVLRQDASMLA